MLTSIVWPQWTGVGVASAGSVGRVGGDHARHRTPDPREAEALRGLDPLDPSYSEIVLSLRDGGPSLAEAAKRLASLAS